MANLGVINPIVLRQVDSDAWVLNCAGLFFRSRHAGPHVSNRAI